MNSEASKSTLRKSPVPAPRLALSQSRELNSFNEDIIRLTWRRRCKLFFLVTLGVITFCSPLFAIMAFDAWLKRADPTELPTLREGFGLILIGMLAIGTFDLMAWLSSLSPRKLEVRDEGITFNTFIFISWSDISRLKMLPVKTQANLHRLVITHKPRKAQNRKDIRLKIPFVTGRPVLLRRSIILQNAQADALLRELAILRQNGIPAPELIDSNDVEIDPLRRSMALVSMLRMVLALLLLFNGLILCMVGSGMAHGLSSKSPPSKSQPLTAREKQFFRTLRKVFSSPNEFVIATYLAGGTMIVLGAGLFGYCILEGRRRAKENPTREIHV